jgi:hypothetical protein
MKAIKVNVHSIIDVITNSSTEIFSGAKSQATEVAKELINKILSEGGSDKTADDLFTFETVSQDVGMEDDVNNVIIKAKSNDQVVIDVLDLVSELTYSEEYYC